MGTEVEGAEEEAEEEAAMERGEVGRHDGEVVREREVHWRNARAVARQMRAFAASYSICRLLRSR